MPRKIIPKSPDHIYHIGARCLNKEWFCLPLPTVWSIMEDYLCFLHHGFGVEIISFVMMSNHYHLLARFPLNNMSSAMNYFGRETSRQITQLSGRINQTYGGRFHRCLIGNNGYLLQAYRYVYQNPLRASLCRQAESYPFSTLGGLVGLRHLAIPVVADDILHASPERTLRWLNGAIDEVEDEFIRRALKKPEFKFSSEVRMKKRV